MFINAIHIFYTAILCCCYWCYCSVFHFFNTFFYYNIMIIFFHLNFFLSTTVLICSLTLYVMLGSFFVKLATKSFTKIRVQKMYISNTQKLNSNKKNSKQESEMLWWNKKNCIYFMPSYRKKYKNKKNCNKKVGKNGGTEIWKFKIQSFLVFFTSLYLNSWEVDEKTLLFFLCWIDVCLFVRLFNV